MKLDVATLAFGFSFVSSAGTPNWATSLGQGKGYKIKDDAEINEIIKGVVYTSVPLDRVSTKIGKGGSLVVGNAPGSPVIMAGVFSKVVVNDVVIPDAKFILLITRDDSRSHAGRLRIKYGPSNTYQDGSTSFSNADFIELVRNKFSLADDACWFIPEMKVVNQNELILKAIFVNKEGSVEYANTDALHKDWNKCEEEQDLQFTQEKFKTWALTQYSSSGKFFEVGTIDNYCHALRNITQKLDVINEIGYANLFGVTDINKFVDIKNRIISHPDFEELNTSWLNRTSNSALALYERFLQTLVVVRPNFPLNRIVFGAPGTGKSFMLDGDAQSFGKNMERVTFHPDYTYAQFVGTYKPVPCKSDSEENRITYRYIPGPFVRVLKNAIESCMRKENKYYLLLIEEINRADVAAVFGDVFQLLDRDKFGESQYCVDVSEDLKSYLARELCIDEKNVSQIKIPSNMYIWATMNSADQGVFPMDTAFKRRWNFEYIDIDKGEEKIQTKSFTTENGVEINWNCLRKAINDVMSINRINEDKLMGTFFIAKDVIDDTSENANKNFVDVFCNKVIMYLFEDAARQKQDKLFYKEANAVLRYSKLCSKFRTEGLAIFTEAINEAYKNYKKEYDDKVNATSTQVQE